MGKKLILIILLLFVIAVIAISIYNARREYKRTIKALTSMDPQHVTVFRIYPRVVKPFGTPIIFNAPDPMIDEFFQALQDRHSYPTSRDRAEWDHSWFLEVGTGDIMIQMALYIPYQKGDIIVGILEGDSYYEDFQSQTLFQWYQKYSHRWLSSPGEQE